MNKNKVLALAITLTALSAFAVGRHTPHYLRIPGYKNCLEKEQKGHASFWCMPAEQPKNCSDHAWQQLNELPANEKVADCQSNERQD